MAIDGAGLMTGLLITLTVMAGLLSVVCWLGWQLLRQNGRILLRFDELEGRLEELEFEEQKSEVRGQKSEGDQSLPRVAGSAATNGEGDGRISRFKDRSVARSR